jgi:hypothetical protein
MCVKVKEKVQDFQNLMLHVANKLFQLLIKSGSLWIYQAIRINHNNKLCTNNMACKNDEI